MATASNAHRAELEKCLSALEGLLLKAVQDPALSYEEKYNFLAMAEERAPDFMEAAFGVLNKLKESENDD